MRRIDLTPYPVTGFDDRGRPHASDYRVRASLVEIAFAPADGVRGSELLRRAAIAQKIEQATGDTLLLETVDWQRLVEAINSGTLKLGRNEVELVRRVLEAPDVPVKEV